MLRLKLAENDIHQILLVRRHGTPAMAGKKGKLLWLHLTVTYLNLHYLNNILNSKRL